MRALLVAAILVSGCAVSACAARPKWYESQPSPTPKQLRWEVDVTVGDPLTTTSEEIKDLHRASKRVVCRLGPIRPADPDSGRPVPEAMLDRLKLCQDKGFDAVAFLTPTDSLVRQAASLRLPVLQLPLAARAEE